MADSDIVVMAGRGERTRGLLLRAGLQLFSTKPVDAVTINEIVECAAVAKGSFFNHFSDKHALAAAVAAQVRSDIESMVSVANEGLDEPLERMARGMRVAVEFALTERLRTLVLLRAQDHAEVDCNPLNSGMSRDLREAVIKGAIRPEAAAWGMLYWLGLCQSLIASTAHQSHSREQASQGLAAMIHFGLSGLGVAEWRAAAIAKEERLLLLHSVLG